MSFDTPNLIFGLQVQSDAFEKNPLEAAYIKNLDLWAEQLAIGDIDLTSYATRDWVSAGFLTKPILDGSTAGKKLAIDGTTGLWTEVTEGGGGGAGANNSLVTIQRNGQSFVGNTFTLNQATPATINIPASDWNAATGTANYIANKPTIPTVNNFVISFQRNGQTFAGNSFTLNDVAARTINFPAPDWSAATGTVNYIANKPTIPSIVGLATETWVSENYQGKAPTGGANVDVLFGVKNGNWVEITGVGGTPFTFDGTLATVATSLSKLAVATTTNAPIQLHDIARTGNYVDLIGAPAAFAGTYLTSAIGQPLVPSAVSLNTANIMFHNVAKSGSYTDLLNQPSIPSIVGLATETWVSNNYQGQAPTGGANVDILFGVKNGNWVEITGVGGTPFTFDGTLATTTTPQSAISTPTTTNAAILLHEIARTGAITTRKQITVGTVVGGITAGTVFPIGTPVDDIIEQLFMPIPLKAYSGALGFANPLSTSRWITIMPDVVVNPQNGSQLTFNLGEKVGMTTAFAYPATLQDATSIVSANQGNVTSTYDKKLVMVDDGNGNLIEYKVYYRWNTINAPAGAIDDIHTLTI